VFSTGVASRIHDVIQHTGAQGARALVLDRRRCPGGDVMAAVELAGDFLGEGAILARIVDGDGDETVYRSHNEHPHAFPVALLVDRHSASAAEVFAGCMKAHGRAVVIGERTLGKGTVQTVVSRQDEPGSRYATVATVALPDGEPIHGRGVEPDVAIVDPPPPPCVADFASPEAILARVAADPALAAALSA
jgi:carboxyl-terminal processing protease